MFPKTAKKGTTDMRQYVIDAFTDKVFAGNPAAVCVMDSWPDEAKMMAITRENNLSETAFAVPEGADYRLRWFTPGGEIDLCGHATLATASAIMNHVEPDRTVITFHTLSGPLTVVRRGDLYEMDFPAYELTPVPVTPAMAEAMNGAVPKAAYIGRDLLVAYQASPRGGTLYCTREGGRIRMSGKAALYAVSDIFAD